MKLPYFTKGCNLAKLKPLYKKGTKKDPRNFGQYHFYPESQRLNYEILNVKQQPLFGFHKNYSTDTSLSYFILDRQNINWV